MGAGCRGNRVFIGEQGPAFLKSRATGGILTALGHNGARKDKGPVFSKAKALSYHGHNRQGRKGVSRRDAEIAKKEGEIGSEVFIEYSLGVLGVLARGHLGSGRRPGLVHQGFRMERCRLGAPGALACGKRQRKKGFSQRRKDRQERWTDDSGKLFLGIPLALLASWREKKRKKKGVSRKDAKLAKKRGRCASAGQWDGGHLVD